MTSGWVRLEKECPYEVPLRRRHGGEVFEKCCRQRIPGNRATELNGGLPTPGAGAPAERARVAVTMAVIGDDGPTAQFLGDTGTIYPW
jgi:hypothetical protein